jgi:hypothetical protein
MTAQPAKANAYDRVLTGKSIAFAEYVILRERPPSESLKLKIARTMRTEIAVSLGWIARRLALKYVKRC